MATKNTASFTQNTNNTVTVSSILNPVREKRPYAYIDFGWRDGIRLSTSEGEFLFSLSELAEINLALGRRKSNVEFFQRLALCLALVESTESKKAKAGEINTHKGRVAYASRRRIEGLLEERKGEQTGKTFCYADRLTYISLKMRQL